MTYNRSACDSDVSRGEGTTVVSKQAGGPGQLCDFSLGLYILLDIIRTTVVEQAKYSPADGVPVKRA